jgi:hypothetical protein
VDALYWVAALVAIVAIWRYWMAVSAGEVRRRTRRH